MSILPEDFVKTLIEMFFEHHMKQQESMDDVESKKDDTSGDCETLDEQLLIDFEKQAPSFPPRQGFSGKPRGFSCARLCVRDVNLCFTSLRYHFT